MTSAISSGCDARRIGVVSPQRGDERGAPGASACSRGAQTCGYRVAVASAARMASSPAGWPFSFEYGPYGVPQTGVPVACRQLSATDPASSTLYPMESMNSVTAAFAGAESPAIGRYERSAAPAGRASDSRCLKKTLLNAFTSMASGMYRSSSSLEVRDSLSSSGLG